jgi:hypothetical protein
VRRLRPGPPRARVSGLRLFSNPKNTQQSVTPSNSALSSRPSIVTRFVLRLRGNYRTPDDNCNSARLNCEQARNPLPILPISTETTTKSIGKPQRHPQARRQPQPERGTARTETRVESPRSPQATTTLPPRRVHTGDATREKTRLNRMSRRNTKLIDCASDKEKPS